MPVMLHKRNTNFEDEHTISYIDIVVQSKYIYCMVTRDIGMHVSISGGKPHDK